MKKTILCLLLALGLLLMSAAAMADDYSFDITKGNITITNGVDEGTLRIQQGSNVKDNIDPGRTICVFGEYPPALTQLIVNATVPVKIAYEVDLPKPNLQSVIIRIADYSDVTLTLRKNPCRVNSNTSQPGIKLGSGSKLTIQAADPYFDAWISGKPSAILGPTDNSKPAATVILNSGTVFIHDSSGSGISGNVNLVINGGTFKANGKDINVKNLIVTGGELWAGDSADTKVTYENLSTYKDQITCEAGILPYRKDVYEYLFVLNDLILPVDLTIPADKVFYLQNPDTLTIPDDRSLICNGWVYLYTDTPLTNKGTLAFNEHAEFLGKLKNEGTLIINRDFLRQHGTDFGTLTNTGIISGSGSIEPKLNQDKPTSLTIESIENGTVTLSAPANANAATVYCAEDKAEKKIPKFEGGIPTEGRTFYAWYEANNFYNASDKTSITVFPVSLNANDGTIASGKDVGYYIAEQSTPLPAKDSMTRLNYTFAGWYDNEELTGDAVTEITKDATGEKKYWAKWRIILTDPDGVIVSGSAAFAKLPPVKVPTLVLPEGVTLGSSVMLKYVKVATTRENTAIYDVYLVDQDGNRVKLPDACTLCLPYPEGLNQSSASAYRIHILHEMDGGRSEDFDSVSGGLELTPQGLCVRIASLSPFTITWERFPEVNLPQTGDSSRPGLWLALGLISAAALAAFALRGRKNGKA